MNFLPVGKALRAFRFSSIDQNCRVMNLLLRGRRSGDEWVKAVIRGLFNILIDPYNFLLSLCLNSLHWSWHFGGSIILLLCLELCPTQILPRCTFRKPLRFQHLRARVFCLIQLQHHPLGIGRTRIRYRVQVLEIFVR